MVIAAVSVLVVVLLAIFLSGTLTTHGLSVFLTTTSQTTTSVQSTSEVTAASTTLASAQITVEAGQRDSAWVRGSANDLPHYATGVNWKVCNEGAATANDVQVTVKSDGVVGSSQTMPLSPATCSANYADLDYSYDTTHQVTVEASSAESKDSRSLVISADLPRVLLQPQGAPSNDLLEVAKLFITPNDPIVKQILKDAIREYQTPSGVPLFKICPDFHVTERCSAWLVLDAIGNYVNLHLVLEPEQDGSHPGYVQLPRETLASRHGDSADLSILEVSLARAAGVDPGSIFVVLGTDGTVTAGWVYDTVGRPFPPMLPNDYHRHGAFLGVYYLNDQEAEMIS